MNKTVHAYAQIKQQNIESNLETPSKGIGFQLIIIVDVLFFFSMGGMRIKENMSVRSKQDCNANA